MGGRGTGFSSRGGTSAAAVTPSTTNVSTTNMAAANAATTPVVNIPTFTEISSSSFQAHLASQNLSSAQQAAVNDYIDPRKVPGSLYAKSQELNNSLRKNIPLTNQQKTMKANLESAMGDIGENAQLVRYDRIGFLQRLGIDPSGRPKPTQAQLNSLVGTQYQENGFVSVSSNGFKNAPANNPFTDKVTKINIQANPKTQGLYLPQGGGGDLGEIILKPNQTFEITGVRYTGKMGRSQRSYYDQIEIDVKVVDN